MEDTDWRPSPCPKCGVMREAARNPVCRNVDCVNDVAKSRMFTSNTPQRYVWIRENGDATVTSDPVKVWQDPNFDQVKDRIYTLGNEVEIKITVEVKNKPVYRERSYAEGTR